MKGKILIVDDDTAHLSMLKTVLKGWGYKTNEADDGSTAISVAQDTVFDGILMDVKMAHVDGIEALQEIKKINPAIPIIIMTAYSSVETAVEAMKFGAYDYLTKPLNFDDLKITLERSLEHMALSRENLSLKERLASENCLSNMIGSSPAMVDLKKMIQTIAPSEATVLILGESGTGKELIARALHSCSMRKDEQLVTVNCAALSEGLLESELFGHEKGSFTGAERKRDGRFMQANKGSIFLDEIGEVPLTMQAKLLRAIQEREIQRVGSDKVLHVDVRIIAATNKDLLNSVKDGSFREDLYYRLNVVSLSVPSLQERREDIPILARFFLDRHAAGNRKSIRNFTPTAMNCLTGYGWPGNVRELENAIERAVVLCNGNYISERELPPALLQDMEDNTKASRPLAEMAGLPLGEIEKEAIIQTLQKTDGNKSEAAKLLNITRTTLNNKIRKYAIL
ncbi:acetoacetate metabolism regulatory protein AtoC [Desulfomarina profundi]|uniref:Acetoacetate metabolism regulatory protein AtoC n=1 Tax=Desulfomarina profundi TaxID=2772557 RepID=A0A8D5FWV3_9BACT|nr:sigma-54 dependent transcriptional regulator [Desulfomarina profundi]BCL61427.1 acetoacetate metabolism regulatory protein AtoC [Desulfomarina profundi]